MHLNIRYLILNGFSTLKYLLSQENIISYVKEDENFANINNISKNNFKNKQANFYNYNGLLMAKQTASMLNQLLEILITLLKNLLSSHVDHFRDSIIINSCTSLIFLLSDFLGNIYLNDTIKLNTNQGNLIKYYFIN